MPNNDQLDADSDGNGDACDDDIADISVTITGKNGNWTEGLITYEIIITNHGPDTAYQIELDHPIDESLTFHSESTNNFICSNSVGQVTCWGDQLEIGDQEVLSFQFATEDQETKFPFEVSVESSTPDSDTSNNVASRQMGGALNILFLLLVVGIGSWRSLLIPH